MTDMKQNKEVMSTQELENVSGGKILLRGGIMPIVFPRFGAGRSTEEKPIFTFVANTKPVCI